MANIVHSIIGFIVILGIINVAFTLEAGKTYNVVAVKEYPYLYEASDGGYYGFIPDLLDSMNISYTIKEATRYGTVYENGTWTGMMNELVQGDADIAALLSITDKRAQHVDFTHPVQSVGPVILMKKHVIKQPSLSEKVSRLLTPFEFSVWLMSFLALLITGTVMYIIAHVNPYEWRRMYKEREATKRESEAFSCLNSFLFVISTLMWQGYVRSPRSVGGRILTLSWWSFVLIFLLTYTASLTNYLRAVRAPTAVHGYANIKSFKDLVDSDDVRVGVIPQGATEAGFRDSKSPVFRQLYDKIIADRTNETNLGSLTELVRYTREQEYSDFALILESKMAKFQAHQEPCDLYMVKDDFNVKLISFGVQKGSPLQEEMSMMIMRRHETGEIHRLENKWFSQECTTDVIRASENQNVDRTAFYRVDIGTFSAALITTVVGVVLGGLVTLIEICIYRWAETHEDEIET